MDNGNLIHTNNHLKAEVSFYKQKYNDLLSKYKSLQVKVQLLEENNKKLEGANNYLHNEIIKITG